MNESVLRALLQLFALVTEAPDAEGVALARKQVRAFLAPKIATHRLEEYLDQFEDYLGAFSRPAGMTSEKKAKKKSSLSSVKVVMLCEEINEQLSRQGKITVLVRLTEFVHKGGQISFRETGFLETLANVFNVSDEVFSLISHFVEDRETEHSELLYISSESNARRKIKVTGMDGRINVLVLPETATAYLRYSGNDSLRLNDLELDSQTVYQFVSGSSITGNEFSPVYHSDVLHAYFQPEYNLEIQLIADEITLVFPNGTTGLHPLSIRASSGKLAGIMGASGAGKSTLLNVLNGNLPATSGSVKINGMPADSRSAKQLVGYVPQDDLLIEELTVFENLYFSGRLCLPDLNKDELSERINDLLQQIDLFAIRNLRVGSVLDKLISGGQRKRLNIALELLREPAVLFVDEPTSGLSSQDSEMVMQLLKHLTFKGQLIFVVIHQPSEVIYKLLDQLLLLDKGGYLVYDGHPMAAPGWFRERAGYVERPGEGAFGAAHVDPDEMLRILEERKIDPSGRITNERVRTPEEWYATFRERSAKERQKNENQPIPTKGQKNYRTPSTFRQFAVYFQRNALAKLRNRAYLLVALFEAPVLAAIIGFFTRYAAGSADNPAEYIFYLNKNLPAFLFMLIVVAIFVGMQISAEEIIRDRKILKRESFLNLSWFSYINSKVLYLLILSAIQSGLLVIVGNLLLSIQGMGFWFFMILFPTFVFANLVGLNISAAFKSVVTIYILVPFLVVPQLLLSGVIVDFDTLQSPENQGAETPVVADIMVARWAYEGLAVAQFKRNAYQRHFFDKEMVKQETLYQFSLRMPKLQNINLQCKKWLENGEESDKLKAQLKLLRGEVDNTNEVFALKFEQVDELTSDQYSTLTADLLNAWLKEIERQYRLNWEKADDRLEDSKRSVSEQLGATDLEQLKNDHHNQKLEEHLKNSHELYKIRQVDDQLVRKTDYIYRAPESSIGRAHFYAPYKMIGNFSIDTLWFNAGVIWLFNVLLYLTLWNNTLLRLLRISSR